MAEVFMKISLLSQNEQESMNLYFELKIVEL